MAVKRYPFAIGATVAGLAGVLSFHSRSTTQMASNALPLASRSTSSSTSTSTPAPSSTDPPAGGGTTLPTSSTTSTTTAQAGPSSATGQSEQYGYGILSVKVTVQNSKITGVQLVGLRTAESYSQQIADQVIPYLKREVLSKQTARIYGISGATYTSEAYAMSVQSALDKLHFH